MKYRSLFLKIFISFWLTMALTIGVLTLMSRISNTESLPERASRGPLGEGLTLYSEAAVRVFEQRRDTGAGRVCAPVIAGVGTEMILFDAAGNPLTSDNAESVATVVKELQANPQDQPPRLFPLFTGATRATWGRFVVSASGRAIHFCRPFSPARRAAALLHRSAHCREYSDCRRSLLPAGPLSDVAGKEVEVRGPIFC